MRTRRACSNIKQKEQLIARAGLLLSLLIATLRQMGMFSSERAEYQERTHFPSTFLPYVLGNRERRLRLVHNSHYRMNVVDLITSKTGVLFAQN